MDGLEREVHLVEDNIDDHPHRPQLIAAYRQFRAGKPQATLDLLKPVVEKDGAANRQSVMAGVLWGSVGDCYFKLDEPDKGFQAYRRSIELDSYTGCLPLFACQVAWHHRTEDAEEALRCLWVMRERDRAALRKHPVHFVWQSLSWEMLYFRFVRLPLTRWRLQRLVNRR
jgi:hypothetical protein